MQYIPTCNEKVYFVGCINFGKFFFNRFPKSFVNTLYLIPSEYMLAISQIYEKVIYCMCMSNELSDFFNNTVGVK